ncbi:MAG: recombination regulator RecX [Rhodocyclaceae bacterium]|nr:recombination regulator RecX [Rhodocyclaceae bacterium]
MLLRKRAINLLARREHSRAELATKLASVGTPEEIDATLVDLERTGLLSDARFTECYLRSHARRQGVVRLRHALRMRGVADHLIDAQLIELPNEMDRAKTVWEKKFATPPSDARERAKQARFLQGRGFSMDVILRLLNDVHARRS